MLSAGSRIGPYEVLDSVGAGGMGEVYRARDSRLGRDVALKVLPPDAAADPERLSRFQREARTVASLDHPHILAVHDVGSDRGVDYVVFELLQGQTLRRRLESGPLPARKVVDYGVQICRGLAAAHEHGVVHRDLKPENLFLSADGQVKILDFGLAKQTGPADEDELPRAETRSALTEAGRMMGTAGYMSPEQAQGQMADARSDLFALGAVLYEMLSGRRAFAGNTPVDTVAAVLRSDPPEIRVEGVPPGLERVVRRCLEKDPGERFQSAHDLGLALETLSGPAPPAGGPRRRRRRALLATAAGLGVVAFAVEGTCRLWTRERQVRAPMRIVPLTADGGFKVGPRLSPDGETVAYCVNYTADRDHLKGAGLYVKSLGRGTMPIRLSDSGGAPAWSPDSRQIAFVRGGEKDVICTVPSFGGKERRLVDVAGPTWAREQGYITTLSWSPDGQWLAVAEKPSENEPARIVRVSLATAEKQPLTFPPSGAFGDLSPELSPDGRTLAFVRSPSRSGMDWDVWVQPVSRPAPRQLTSGRFGYCNGLAWTEDGKEVVFSTSNGYTHGGRMLRVPASGGPPVPLAGVGSDVAGPSIRAGRMVHEQLAPASWDVWRMPGRRSTVTERKPEKLIASRWSDNNSAYSPDGRRISFNSDRSGSNQVWISDGDGANPVQVTAFDAASGSWLPWSPDGRRIVFASAASGNREIYVVDSEGGVARRLTREPSDEDLPTFSRDGRHIYFSSDRSGRWEIWRIPAEGGTAVQVTHRGGYAGQESWDARYLYYCKSRKGSLWRVPVGGGDEAPVPGVEIRDWFQWAVSKTGIYWAVRSFPRAWVQGYAIHFSDFQTGRTETLVRIRNAAVSIFLAVSPDDEWILYSEEPYPESELMLVENFR